MSIHSIYDSKINDTININGRNYTVKGFIEYQGGIYKWKDFWIVNPNNEKSWLTVDTSTSKQYVILSKEVPVFSTTDKFSYKSNEFIAAEKGYARVTAVEGISNVDIGEVFDYIDFTSTDMKDIILSYERWEWNDERGRPNLEEEYFEGKLIPLNNIASGIPEKENKDIITLKHWRTLKVGSSVVINNKTYTVDGYACYNSKSGDEWLEYLIYDNRKDYWLCVENGPNYELTYSLHQNVKHIPDYNSRTVIYNNKKFGLSESVSGEIILKTGNVDYDNYEKFVLWEFISDDNQILSIEEWEDETECSLGYYIPANSVSADFGNPDSAFNTTSRILGMSSDLFPKVIKYSAITIAGIFLVALFFQLSKKSIRDRIDSDAGFKYITTITVEEPEKHKEFVYKSSFNLDATCKRIIKMDPENIEYVTIDNSQASPEANNSQTLTEASNYNNSKDDNISQRFIRSKDAIILIYQGEDESTYVQINEDISKEEKKEHRRHYGYHRYMYRPHRFYSHDSDFYDNSINRSGNVNTEQYSGDLLSARQESIRTRNSSGGGTGFGK